MTLDLEMKQILNGLAERLTAVYGSKLKAVILYGSVAKGTAAADSDIDILLLVDVDAEELKKYEEELCNVSSDYSLKYFKVFSIMDVCYREFHQWKKVLPFYRNVDQEGIVIYAA